MYDVNIACLRNRYCWFYEGDTVAIPGAGIAGPENPLAMLGVAETFGQVTRQFQQVATSFGQTAESFQQTKTSLEKTATIESQVAAALSPNSPLVIALEARAAAYDAGAPPPKGQAPFTFTSQAEKAAYDKRHLAWELAMAIGGGAALATVLVGAGHDSSPSATVPPATTRPAATKPPAQPVAAKPAVTGTKGVSRGTLAGVTGLTTAAGGTIASIVKSENLSKLLNLPPGTSLSGELQKAFSSPGLIITIVVIILVYLLLK